MPQCPVGRLAQLTRYPVKSMAGEELERADVAAYGLYGDRSHAFVDETKEGWDRYVTARQIAPLLRWRASLGEGGTGSGEYPTVHIVSPEGEAFGWDDGLLRAVQRYTDRRLSLLRCRPDTGVRSAVDTGGILIVTDRSLSRLAALLGRHADSRRFRANFIVALDGEDVPGEAGWVGRRLRIGGAVLEVTEPCERCSVIAIDPDTLARDSGLLRTVNDEMNLHFGVYASTVSAGTVGLGDVVLLEE